MVRANFNAGEWNVNFSNWTVQEARKEAFDMLIASKKETASITWDDGHVQILNTKGEWTNK